MSVFRRRRNRSPRSIEMVAVVDAVAPALFETRTQ
jgi:hypothetical protein